MMDPLSDVLSLLNARGVLSVRLIASGDWCIQFPAYESIRFGTVTEGNCWLAVEGMEQPVQLQAGDCYLLTDGLPYKLASKLALPPIDMHEVYAGVIDRVVRYNGKTGDHPDMVLIGGRFMLDAANASFLLDRLPSVVHVRAESDQANVLRWVLDRLAMEQLANEAGASSMVEHLVHIMLVQTLRTYIASGAEALSGWLAALSDEKIGAALGLMHATPSQRWKLEELARSVGMSRSAFALRFKNLVGISPLDYLLRWRMRLAGQALVAGKASVSSIGLSFGYESESAFSNAFKRVMGRSPREYRIELIKTTPGEKPEVHPQPIRQ